MPIHIYVDADACPAKDDVLKVAERHNLRVTFIGNRWLRGLDHPLVDQVVAPEGLDAADNLIAEKIAAGDLVVTADIPLAERCLKAGAQVLAPNGRPFTFDSIGAALAGRAVAEHLRSIGETTSGPRPFGAADRSRFLQALDEAANRARRPRR